MEILPIRTTLLMKGDDLAEILSETRSIQDGDIVVISSKAVATCEGAAIDLSRVNPSAQAEQWAKKCGRSPQFCEAVHAELKRMSGKALGFCPGAILTEVKPEGLDRGVILTANAGLDESNIEKGFAIGWPRDAVKSVRMLQHDLQHLLGDETRETRREKYSSVSRVPSPESRVSVIITDSCCRPRRLGVTAFALTCCGLGPLASQAGKEDLFGKPLRITTEAVADQLATAANFVMGNAGQSVPAAIIRDHDLPFSDFCGWVDGIEPREDLFAGIL